MEIKKLQCLGQQVYVLLDEDERIVDWTYLDNIERLTSRTDYN